MSDSRKESLYLAIIGSKDNAIYSLEFGTSRQGGEGVSKFTPDMKQLCPFIVHSSLDIVDEVQWTTPTMYLKVIDKFYNYYVSAFVTAGNIKFLLLHENRAEDSIRQFFQELYDLYTKTLISPFYSVNQTITSKNFDHRVRNLAKKYL
ncbi:Sedlin [Lipomyces japonicus]|uniref:Sedlin n=1 Tax=Lipomyces japonicus TaxID=56871 RepID=UPI0034CE3FFA